MNAAPQNAETRRSSEPGWIERAATRLKRWIDNLSVAEKLYSIVALLVVVTIFLLAMSIQTVRLQSSYRHLEASSSRAANDIGRVDALIYAVVMESRGVYMSTARAWGDNDANRELRSQLNVDLEALAKIYHERAREAAELGDLGQYACWYLFGLGLAALLFAAVNLQV